MKYAVYLEMDATVPMDLASAGTATLTVGGVSYTGKVGTVMALRSDPRPVTFTLESDVQMSGTIE